MRNIVKKIIIAILVIGLFLFVGYMGSFFITSKLNKDTTVQLENQNSEEIVTVVVRKIVNETINEKNTYLGIINYEQIKIIVPNGVSKLTSINKSSSNCFYKKGVALCEFDSERFKHELSKQKVELEYLSKQMERLEELQKTGSVSESQFEEVKYKYQSCQEEIKKISYEIKKTIVIAPFDCVISVNNNILANGTDVNQGQEIMTIYNVSTLNVELKIPSQEISSVNNSVPVIIYNNQKIQGKISYIAPNIQSSSNALQVFVNFSNKNTMNLLNGQTIEVIFTSKDSEKVVRLEEEAIIVHNMQSYVFVIRNGLACKIPVKTLKIQGDSGKLKVCGLQNGDLVVILGANKLNNSSKVIIKEEQK